MTEPLFSIVFDQKEADRELTPLPVESLLLAVLAREPPLAEWEGCLVFEGETPLDAATTRCIGISGPHADAVQQRLIENLESLNIPVRQVYDGGPAARLKIARVRDGKWDKP